MRIRPKTADDVVDAKRMASRGSVRSPAELAARMREQADEQMLAREALDATKKAVEEGEAILQKTRDDYRLDEPSDDEGPRMRAYLEGDRSIAAPPVWQLSDEMADIIRTVVNSADTARGVVASAAIAALRERYDALDPRDLPDAIQTWEGFAARYVPLPAERVAELVGRMVHAGDLLRCVACGAKSKSVCACGKPYNGTHRWGTSNEDAIALVEAFAAFIEASKNGGTVVVAKPEPEPEPEPMTALDRAIAALIADPGKSDRAIGEEIRVSHQTVKRARQRMKGAGQDVTVDVTVGRDGRSRRPPRHHRPPPPISNPVKEVNAFHGELVGFLNDFSDRFRAWRESDPALDEDGKAALMQALYLCGDGFMRVAQELDGR
jgi:hypothetical protein